MQQKRAAVVVLDLGSIVRFLRSVALARATAEVTRLQWKSYDDSAVLNIAYALLFWKEKPGWAEVNTGTPERILARTRELTQQLWHAFRQSLNRGPVALTQHLQTMDRVRTASLESVQQQFNEARAINEEVVTLSRQAISRLAHVKLAADLVVKLSPLPAVSVPYSMTTTFIKEFGAAASADVVLFKVGLEPAKEGTKALAEHGSKAFAQDAIDFHVAVHNARIDIARQHQMLRRGSATRRSIDKATDRLDRATGAAASGARAAGGARAASHVLKGLQWGFVALDVYESWHDYAEALEL